MLAVRVSEYFTYGQAWPCGRQLAVKKVSILKQLFAGNSGRFCLDWLIEYYLARLLH
jgi:hypothetical protein